MGRPLAMRIQRKPFKITLTRQDKNFLVRMGIMVGLLVAIGLIDLVFHPGRPGPGA